MTLFVHTFTHIHNSVSRLIFEWSFRFCASRNFNIYSEFICWSCFRLNFVAISFAVNYFPFQSIIQLAWMWTQLTWYRPCFIYASYRSDSVQTIFFFFCTLTTHTHERTFTQTLIRTMLTLSNRIEIGNLLIPISFLSVQS